jgi:hypothetical protein
MDKPSCGACRSFRTNPEDLSKGECHHGPPTASLQVTPQGIVALGVWPPVQRQQECECFEPRPVAVLVDGGDGR